MKEAFKLEWGQWSLDIAARPHIMGIINITPDSFSDGGDFLGVDLAVQQGLRLVEAGADILDVGGESTRPGAAQVGEQEEMDRVVPLIEALAARVPVPISVDTYKSRVAEEALRAGAAMVNDISAGRFEPQIFEVSAAAGVPLILMHMQGEPRNMQQNPVYHDLMGEIRDFLREAMEKAEAAGVPEKMIILDPGLGFGKTFDHNLALINRLKELADLGRPLLLGPSRKAFLGRILGGVPPKERDAATATVTALCAYNGAHILRVHNVDMARQALTVVGAVMHEHV